MDELSIITYLFVLIFGVATVRYGINSIRFGLAVLRTHRTPPGDKWWHNQQGNEADLIGRRIFLRGIMFSIPGVLAFLAVIKVILDTV
jgi:hypothetical protein